MSVIFFKTNQNKSINKTNNENNANKNTTLAIIIFVSFVGNEYYKGSIINTVEPDMRLNCYYYRQKIAE